MSSLNPCLLAAAQVAWYDVGSYDFWAPAPTLEAISFFLFLFAETRRLMDMYKPGSQVNPTLPYISRHNPEQLSE